MNRRLFLTRTSKLALVLATAPAILATGCTESVKDLLNTVIDATAGLLKVVEPSASWFGPLQSALTALTASETDWMNGGGVQIIESALATVEAVLGAIPITAVYSPLIAILISGIDALLEKLYPAGKAPVALKVSVYRGRVALKKPHALQSSSSAFRSQWNQATVVIGLPAAKIAA